MQMQTKASKGSCRLDRRKCPLQCSESSTESSRAEQRSRLSYRAVVGLAAAPRPGCGAVSNCSAGRPGTYRRPGWTRTSTRAAVALVVLPVDLTPFWLERLGRFAEAQNLSVGTPSHRRDEASQHAPCVVRARVPVESVCAEARPELKLVPVQSARQRLHLLSYCHQGQTASGMGVPPPSSSLSSLSSSSLAAANDTRDAIALSRRASSRPSELGIALVFPALIHARLTAKDACIHVHVDAVCPGPRLASSPFPVLASFPSPTVGLARTDRQRLAGSHRGERPRWTLAPPLRLRVSASTGNLAAFGSAL
ncbi:hypothetical protein M441DRAFT_64072 [Trichoderma asperellum CBS 433.97]|uniref:Uncharacterized protein n=1 Tax=Trichoderma asperellum (strain ATCC 204424 / CBS 433.97 / NBRC 101777) TaxID=1042311 RepID=A0A2T3ZPS2_TRIA4|nr:hypothetical protein M441DRAFT_64072 [Trichoderma asperellum CBS 433.97]PTB46813.1 hypothetical protein M441DRAFT_64072 [Trichoderma asperellum CBS 433.97]